MESDTIKVIDLFCGCGGFSTGFKQAGHDIILAIDMWETALKSHELNHVECEHWLEDIRNITYLPECDIIIGSPPCQNISNANTNKNYVIGLELVHEFERIVQLNKPKHWIWENVAPVKQFYPNAAILNSFDFGLPQKRKRAFVSNFSMFRNGIKKGYLTQELGYSGSKAENIGIAAIKHRTKSGTVTTKRIRNLDTNEYLDMGDVKHLMGFPENYKLYGGISLQQKQLGNAVCPPIAREFGECLLPQR